MTEERKEEGRKVVQERIYTIPLRKVWSVPRKKRAPRAARLVRDFIKRHMKPERIVIDSKVNEKIWSRGIEKPPTRIRVKVDKDQEGLATVSLVEE